MRDVTAIAALCLLRGAASGRGIGASHCMLPDTHERFEKDPRSNGRHRIDIFVSGVEGAGHHGAVGGFLAPFMATAVGVDRGLCMEIDENPFYVSLNRLKRDCRAFAAIGWESFPSDRRLGVRDRLAALYESPLACFPQPKLKAGTATAAEFPSSWASANPIRRNGCWRCGSWEATLEDVYLRLLRSDRLDVATLSASMASLRVLVLWRDFSRAAFSHSQLDGKGRGHAMVLAAHAALMARDAALLPRGAWRVLRYESLLGEDSYASAAVAVAAFLKIPAIAPYDTPAGLRAAAAAARNESWRAPSARKEAQYRADPRLRAEIAEVERYFSHRWAAFDDPEAQLLPQTTAVVVAPAPPQNATAASQLAGCPPPDVAENRCRKCTPSPVTSARDATRLCVQPPAWVCCHPLKRRN